MGDLETDSTVGAALANFGNDPVAMPAPHPTGVQDTDWSRRAPEAAPATWDGQQQRRALECGAATRSLSVA
eukprot:1035404-Lingulodinium_polyedra.AAC.1